MLSQVSSPALPGIRSACDPKLLRCPPCDTHGAAALLPVRLPSTACPRSSHLPPSHTPRSTSAALATQLPCPLGRVSCLPECPGPPGCPRPPRPPPPTVTEITCSVFPRRRLHFCRLGTSPHASPCAWHTAGTQPTTVTLNSLHTALTSPPLLGEQEDLRVQECATAH